MLLGEIAAQALERAGLRVERKLDLGGTFVCHQALVAGELDLYPEYTGTGVHRDPQGEADRGSRPGARAVASAEYARRWKLVWAPPLGFENTFALVVRAGQARELGIAKISDLARHAELRPGFGYEFVERADGFPGLAAAYGLAFAARPAEMDLGLLYPALAQGKVDVVAGNSTDGLIAAIGSSFSKTTGATSRRTRRPSSCAARSGRTRACAARSNRFPERSRPTRCVG